MHPCTYTHNIIHTHLGAVSKRFDDILHQMDQEEHGVELSIGKEWEEPTLVDGKLVRRPGRGNQLVHYTHVQTIHAIKLRQQHRNEKHTWVRFDLL